MAGSYADPPGRRIEYDRDGSGAVFLNSSLVVATMSSVQAQGLNDELTGSTGPGITTARWVGVVFPVAMDIVGVFCVTVQAGGGAHTVKWQSSTDTTTGADGTWGDIVAGYTAPTTTPFNYRSQIKTVSGTTTNLKGVRFLCATLSGSGGDTFAMHLYGNRSSSTGNWLTMWHPTLNQALHVTPAYTDLGDVGLNAGYQTLSFRVKNSSSSLTAQGITLLREALTDGSPSIVGLTELRFNGGSWGSTATVGDLSPGSISSVCDVRVNVDATAPPSLWAPRVIANATTWV